MRSHIVRIGLVFVLVLALVGGGAGFAVADHDTENNNCEGQHTADENTEDTEGNDSVSHNHGECHENEHDG